VYIVKEVGLFLNFGEGKVEVKEKGYTLLANILALDCRNQ